MGFLGMAQDVNGDRLARFAQTHGEKSWRVACALTRNAHDAEDVVQAAYMVAARKGLPRFGSWPWFAAVIRGEAANLRRRLATRRSEQFDEGIHSQNDDRENGVEQREMQERLRDGLAALPEDEREVLTMTFVAGLSHRQAARAMNLPLGTIKTRVRRGLGHLRETVGGDEGRVGRALAALAWPQPAAGMGAFGEACVTAALAMAGTGAAATGAAVGLGGMAMKKVLAIAAGALVLILGAVTAIDRSGANEDEPNLPMESGIASAGKSGQRHTDAPAAPEPVKVAPAPQPVPAAAPEDADAKLPVEMVRKDVVPETETVAATEAEPEPGIGAAFSCLFAGVAVDEQGRGLAGAGISAAIPEAASATNALKVGGTAITDDLGRFELSVTGRRDERLDRARLVLHAAASGYPAVKTLPYTAQAGDEFRGIRLTFRRGGGTIIGRVVRDSTGEPLPGVMVEARGDLRSYSNLNASNTNPEARVDQSGDVTLGPVFTDGDGRFRFDGLIPGTYGLAAWRPAAAGDGSAAEQVRGTMDYIGVTNAVTGPVLLRLADTGVLAFAITNEGVTETEVTLDALPRDIEPEYQSRGSVIRPGGDGVYRVTWLTHATTHAVIKASGFAAAAITLPIRERLDHDLGIITLHKGATVSGRVVDESGKGISGSAVSKQASQDFGFSSAGGPAAAVILAETTTDENGFFKLGGLEPGQTTIAASASGFVTGSRNLRIRDGQDQDDVVIKLAPAGALEGTVQLPPRSGGGLEGESHMLEADAVVLAKADNVRVAESVTLDFGMLGYLAGASDIRTDIGADGSFRIDSIRPGTYFGIAIYARRATYVRSITIRAGETTAVNFVFPAPGGVVWGSVTRSGTPLPSHGVSLAFRVPEGGMPRMGGAYAVTDSSGVYRFENVQPGEFTVLVPGEDIRNASAMEHRTAVVGGHGSSVRVDLKLEGQRVRMHGRLTLDGAPGFERVFLRPAEGGEKEYAAFVDADGDYQISDVPPGEYTVGYQYGAPEGQTVYGTGAISLAEGAGDVEYSRDFRGASLQGHVTAAEGQVMAGRHITINLQPWMPDRAGNVAPKNIWLQATVAGDGFYRFHKLIAGKYDMLVEPEGLEAVRKTLTLTGDVTEDVVLSGDAGSVTVTLTSFGGFSEEEKSRGFGAGVRLFDRSGQELLTRWGVEFTAERSFTATIGGLAAGVYDLEVFGFGFSSQRVPGVVVSKDEPRTLQVPINRVGEAVIEVTNPELSAVDIALAALLLVDPKGQAVDPVPETGRRQPFAPPTKVWRLRPLATGQYTLTASLPGYQQLVVTFRVAEGSAATRVSTSFVKSE